HALSINWGLWRDVGFIARLGHAQGPGAVRGMKTIAPDRGVRILERLLASHETQSIVWPCDWDEWAQLYPAYARTPRVAHLLHTSAPLRDATHGPGWSRLHDLPAAEQCARLHTYLGAQIAARLRIDVAELGSDRPLEEFGFDSLQAADLKVQIRHDLVVDIPV